MAPPFDPHRAGFSMDSCPNGRMGSLDFLINIQGEIKRLRELAARASDQKLASKLYRLADDMEQRARVIDRALECYDNCPGSAVQPSQLLRRLSLSLTGALCARQFPKRRDDLLWAVGFGQEAPAFWQIIFAKRHAT